MRIRATSRVLTVIGDPIDHSLSPAMYNAAIAALGLDAVYVALRVEPAALAHVIRAFEAVGMSGNVTVPHKMPVASLLIRLTSIAKELGAVNTFWSEGGRLIGDNTDVQGVLDAVQALNVDGPWVVVGTGGAARAVAAAARAERESILVRSRDPDRAHEFVAWAKSLGVEARSDDGSAVGVVINASPLGLNEHDSHPVPDDRLARCRAVLDLVYRPGGTPWVRQCRERGMLVADGRNMLVGQGARAFERFFPGETAPREIMASAVERELAGR